MDHTGGDAGESEGKGIIYSIFDTIFWLVCLWQLLKRCRQCCRRSKDESALLEKIGSVHQPEPLVSLDQLQERKCLSTSYALWSMAGLFGVHHFYLGRVVHGFIAVWSLNFLGIGWIVDAFLLPRYVRRHNSVHTEELACYDSSRRTLCKIALAALASLVFLVCLVVYTPRILHLVGYIDLDQLSAEIRVNPYDVLEISRFASFNDVKAAYRKASLEWHPDRNVGCGTRCEKKMSEITKAFQYIKERSGRGGGGESAEEGTWATGFVESLGKEWMHVIQAYQTD